MSTRRNVTAADRMSPYLPVSSRKICWDLIGLSVVRKIAPELWGVCAFGLLNAVLYASLMPLWEGFDEPFHYGYVQALDSRHSLPVLGHTPLSDEIFASLSLAPASSIVKHNLPFAVTFSEHFAMPEAERRSLRDRLWNPPPGSRSKEAVGTNNYEAQQAPLAYVAMVPADLFWRDVTLPRRVWMLRLFCAVIATILEALLAILLARTVGLDLVWHASVLLLIFSSQMFYAAAARVSNDWLAAPAVTLLFLAALRFR